MIKKYCAALLIACTPIETGFAQISATPQSALPECLNSPGALAEIQRVQAANAKTSHKYDGYRAVLGAKPALELAARLAYAETLAANCPKQNDRIADLVTAVIGNRIRIRRGDIGSVVFQRDQFASSLNIYPESRYRDFLCPRDAELWEKIVAKVRAHLAALTPGASLPADAVNYYLYRHSERFKAPAWKLAEVSSADEAVHECVRVFRNPQWQ